MSNEVFFLGAGFSIALGKECITNSQKYPSLSELTFKVLSDFSKNSLKTHLQEISDKYKRNIEELLTYLSTDLPWQNQQMVHLDKALYFEIDNKIAKYFNKLDSDSRYNFSKYQILGNYILDNQIPIITLNYDTLLENFLFSCKSNEYKKVNSFRSFYKQAINNLSSRRQVGSFGFHNWHEDYNGELLTSICKLHGSINWLWPAVNSSDPIYFTEGTEHYSLKKDLLEYIVPPILDKTKFYNHNILKSVWVDAYNAIKNANRIFIIGFSFPTTDLSVKFLFNSALSDRLSYPEIYAINTADAINSESKNYIKKRYSDIFGNNVHYDYCCDNSLEKFVKEVIEPKLEVINAN